MTDLSKGIIEIEGFEINRETTLDIAQDVLKELCEYHFLSDDKDSALFVFKNIKLYDRCFDVDITFLRKKISVIKLFSYYDKNLSYDARFESDCEWLKSILGEPDDVDDESNYYLYDNIRIYSFIQRDLSRNPAETFIVCKYGR